MSHHTDAGGAQLLVELRHPELVEELGHLTGEMRQELYGETVRNALYEFVIQTRRNEPRIRCMKTLKGIFGIHAELPGVLDVVDRLQADAWGDEPKPRSSHAPLPLGVATPVPNEHERTTQKHKPVLAHEAYAQSAQPTKPFSPRRPGARDNSVQGPWPRKKS